MNERSVKNNNNINIFNQKSEQQDWLQIYCAVIAGRYHVYETGVQDATAAIDLTDDLFADYQELWNGREGQNNEND